VWNVKTAVSRLSYAPSPKDMKVTDVKTGRFTFVPPPAKPVSWQELQKAVVKAGYGIEGTAIEVRGRLGPDGLLRASGTGQAFALAGPRLAELQKDAQGAAAVTVYGRWRVAPKGAAAETIEAERWEIAR
jgi:hypothetical protein